MTADEAKEYAIANLKSRVDIDMEDIRQSLPPGMELTAWERDASGRLSLSVHQQNEGDFEDFVREHWKWSGRFNVFLTWYGDYCPPADQDWAQLSVTKIPGEPASYAHDRVNYEP